MSDIEKRIPQVVRRFLLDNAPTEGSRPLVVGVSGGADSVCLLHVLFSLKDELGLKLHVAHLNHGLRGGEADADAEYVASLAQRLGLPATIESRDVEGYRIENRCSLEEAAREVRYRFFAEVAQSLGTDAVMLGHTADDQAETILLHLIRGTGLSGLEGMRPVSHWQLPSGTQLNLIRPLLEVNREDTQAYCAIRELYPRVDSSNVSLQHLRNRIRYELLPKLEEYNPGIRESLSRCARTVADDVAYLDDEVSRIWSSVVEEMPRGMALDNEAFSALPASLKRHLLRAALGWLSGTPRDIELVHIEILIEVLERPAGKSLSLPHGLTFYGGYEKSIITTGESVPCPLPSIEGKNALSIPGETVFSGWKVRVEIHEEWSESADTDYKVCLDFDRVGSELFVRTRRPGDRFQPLGMSDTKKLQDFMVDAKIPQSCRDRVPLVCCGEWIVWVVGWRIDHRARVTESTKRVLEVEFERD
ncbi:MAG: tRNA lysidine(34) synthetase TilS [Dehalococcoidia bacterium]